MLFDSEFALRTYILNRPKKLNALDDDMLHTLRPKIEVRTMNVEFSTYVLPAGLIRNGVSPSFVGL